MRPSTCLVNLSHVRQIALFGALLCTPYDRLAAQSFAVGPATLVVEDAQGILNLNAEATRMRVDPRGSVLVADWRRGGLYMLARGVSEPHRIGAYGGGPGEFKRVGGFGWIADTLWVSDPANARITFFPRWGEGKPSTTRYAPSAGGVGTSVPQAFTRSGHAIVQGSAPYSRDRAVSIGAAIRTPLLVTSRDGARILDTLTTLNVAKRIHEIILPDGVFISRQPFVGEDLWSASANGEFIATVLQSNDSDTAASVLSLRRSSGEVTFVKRLAQERVQRGMFERVADSLFAELNTLPDGRRSNEFDRRAYFAALKIPQRAAAVSKLLVSATGDVLVVGPVVGKSRAVHTVWSAEGTLRGTFLLPVNETVCGFEDKSIWILTEQEDGVRRLSRRTLGPMP